MFMHGHMNTELLAGMEYHKKSGMQNLVSKTIYTEKLYLRLN
jgi:hypothetical protein